MQSRQLESVAQVGRATVSKTVHCEFDSRPVRLVHRGLGCNLFRETTAYNWKTQAVCVDDRKPGTVTVGLTPWRDTELAQATWSGGARLASRWFDSNPEHRSLVRDGMGRHAAE